MFSFAAAVRVSDLAALQYVGLSGISASCHHAVKRLVQYRDAIEQALILTCREQHALLLTLPGEEQVAVKSGFSSGYSGEGPRTFAEVLLLLQALDVPIDECNVSPDLMDRLEASALTLADLQIIKTAKLVRPQRWQEYVYDAAPERGARNGVFATFRPVMPWAIIDPRITDLAKRFFDSPDDCILTGFRRLEDAIRKRTGLDEHGRKLFAEAFSGDDAKLEWTVTDKGEQVGRAQLFVATFMAYRNPRAHRELRADEGSMLMEFLMLNQLFVLEAESTPRNSAIDH